MSLNGYVRVPDSSVLRKFDSYDDIDVDVHGGLTYGPYNREPFTIPATLLGGEEREIPGHVSTWEDCQGWVGFDTGHSCDYWEAEDLPWPDDEEGAARKKFAKEFYDKNASFGATSFNWTVEKVIEETEWLCSQLQAAEYALIEGTTDGTDLGSAIQEDPAGSDAEGPR